MLPQTFQKHLDKQRQQWYNNRKIGKDVKRSPPRKEPMELVDNLSSSVNKQRSELTREIIVDIGKAINTVANNYSNLRTPVIAGGAVRDMIYGVTPSDYDIFFDTSHLPAEEREDFTLLFGASVTEELAKGEPYKVLRDNVLLPLGDGSAYGSAAMPKAWKEFYVYETSWPRDEEIDLEWEVHRREQGPEVADRTIRFVKLQFIGRTEETLAADDPLPFLDSFDWSLTKALFDPKDMEFKLSEAFLAQQSNPEIECHDLRTLDRVRGWTYRFNKKDGPCPFKVVNKIPKNPMKGLTISQWDTSFYATSTTNAVWDNF